MNSTLHNQSSQMIHNFSYGMITAYYYIKHINTLEAKCFNIISMNVIIAVMNINLKKHLISFYNAMQDFTTFIKPLGAFIKNI